MVKGCNCADKKHKSSSSSSSECPTSSSSKSCNTTSSSTSTCVTSSSCSKSSSCTVLSSDSSSSSSECHKKKCEECPPRCENVDCKCLMRCADKNHCGIRANVEISLVLQFILDKLQSFNTNIGARKMSDNSTVENIKWVEKFMDIVLCTLTTKDLFKSVTVQFCKVKNDCESMGARQYVIKITVKGCSKIITKNFSLVFAWNQLNYNDNRSFIGVVRYVTVFLTEQIALLAAENNQTSMAICC